MAQHELTLRDYLVVFRKRRWVILLIFISTITITVICTNLQKPVYQASSSIRIVERKTLASMLTDIFVYATGDPLASAARVVKSYDIALRVAKELNLPHANATEAEYGSYAILIQASTITEEIQKTNILKIDITHSDPEITALVANKTAEVFIDVNLKEKNKQARTIRKFIEERLEESKAALAESEEVLVAFKEKENVEGVAIPLGNKLAELEGRRSELLLKFTELHPDVLRSNEQIESLKQQLGNLPEKELELVRLNRMIQINERAYRELEDKFREAQIVEAEKVPDVSIVETAYTPSSPISPNRAMNLLMGIVLGAMISLVSAFMIEHLDTSIGTIEDVEELLDLPVVGVIPHLVTKGELSPRFIPSKLRRILTKKVKYKKGKSILREQLVINYPPKSPIAESYRICYTNISVEVLKDRVENKIIILTSAGPSEGKSITASNLAIAVAQRGKKVLLVDADLRRSILHKVFGLKDKRPGLTDILMETASFKDSVRTLPDFLLSLGWDETLKHPALENLSILPAGTSVVNPAEILSSENLNTFFEEMRQNFDMILLDSPPVLAVTDPSIIGPKTDGVILIYEVGKVARAALLRAKIQLESVKSSPKAVILNNISPDVQMYSDYYYHYRYYGTDKTEKS